MTADIKYLASWFIHFQNCQNIFVCLFSICTCAEKSDYIFASVTTSTFGLKQEMKMIPQLDKQRQFSGDTFKGKSYIIRVLQ